MPRAVAKGAQLHPRHVSLGFTSRRIVSLDENNWAWTSVEIQYRRACEKVSSGAAHGIDALGVNLGIWDHALCAHAALSVLQDEFNYTPKIAKDWDIHAMLFLVRMRASAARAGIRRNIRYSRHK
jgi:hypothetical protein